MALIRKMRRTRYKDNRKYHLRKGFVKARLSDELRKKLGTKTKTVRKGDTVKMMRGENNTKEGKVLEVDYKEAIVYVEGITIKNAKGVDKLTPVNSSKLMIIAVAEGPLKRERAATTAAPASREPTPAESKSIESAKEETEAETKKQSHEKLRKRELA
ncbi:50S ribosomal protein L24 [Candidatus Micrarchaeota archaeon CG08_land_8_20_14_0_20_49_17]|nr:MAG: 50S ribosomal protein L24 [Candidatus Micrarchaeota archaeon CG08_land_8_20_14_0_20_49_17]PIZ98202.1 MAG: 50S ribosomal protein L24 [Candidatus Micrarchaeota archaeon CG_4_10_14_0_2_um_filter_49_7]HII53292.1 50S ribosomal protein L24 [Candidatus Micrarchaeota archaeon]